MKLRGIALALLVTAAIGAACGGSDDAGLTLDEPIGGPHVPDHDFEKRSVADSDARPVAKRGTVEMNVPRDSVNTAAQKVLDVATSARVGGFLISSDIDLREGNGMGRVHVRVPSPRFEDVVADLSSIGEITRQHLQGRDLSGEFAATDATTKRRILSATAYSDIDVSIAGEAPPPAPEKPAFERALATSKSIALAIGSGSFWRPG